MAELLGIIASGITVAEALYKAKTLLTVIDSFKHKTQKLQQLRDELNDLIYVLETVNDNILATTDREDLKLPLERCAKLCRKFEELIATCTRHSKSGESVRDWIKTNVKDDEIQCVQRLIHSYKLTISIVIGTIELRASKATADEVKKWSEHIADTRSTLEQHMSLFTRQIQVLLNTETCPDIVRETECKKLQTERQRLQQCLHICNRGAMETKRLRDDLQQDVHTQSAICHSDSMKQLDDTLRFNSEGYRNLEGRFGARMEEIDVELAAVRFREYHVIHQVDAAHRSKVFEKVTKEVNKHYENIKAAEGSTQIIGSATDTEILARNIDAGSRAEQYLGASEAVLLARFGQSQMEPGHVSTVEAPPELVDRDTTRLSIRQKLFSRLRL